MRITETSGDADTDEGEVLPRRARLFHYLALTGFAINMLVVALIFGYWLFN